MKELLDKLTVTQLKRLLSTYNKNVKISNVRKMKRKELINTIMKTMDIKVLTNGEVKITLLVEPNKGLKEQIKKDMTKQNKMHIKQKRKELERRIKNSFLPDKEKVREEIKKAINSKNYNVIINKLIDVEKRIFNSFTDRIEQMRLEMARSAERKIRNNAQMEEIERQYNILGDLEEDIDEPEFKDPKLGKEFKKVNKERIDKENKLYKFYFKMKNAKRVLINEEKVWNAKQNNKVLLDKARNKYENFRSKVVDNKKVVEKLKIKEQDLLDRIDEDIQRPKQEYKSKIDIEKELERMKEERKELNKVVDKGEKEMFELMEDYKDTAQYVDNVISERKNMVERMESLLKYINDEENYKSLPKKTEDIKRILKERDEILKDKKYLNEYKGFKKVEDWKPEKHLNRIIKKVGYKFKEDIEDEKKGVSFGDEEIKEYELSDEEKEFKKKTKIDLKKCIWATPKKLKLPCKLKRSIFNTANEIIDYIRLKQNRAVDEEKKKRYERIIKKIKKLHEENEVMKEFNEELEKDEEDIKKAKKEEDKKDEPTLRDIKVKIMGGKEKLTKKEFELLEKEYMNIDIYDLADYMDRVYDIDTRPDDLIDEAEGRGEDREDAEYEAYGEMLNMLKKKI